MTKPVLLAALALGTTLIATSVFAHCEIPCGIYGDAARFYMISEHCDTIEKSMAQVVQLGSEEPQNNNQLVRWVQNKEDHANEVQEIVSQYFLTQRIKPDQPDYEARVTTLHQMLVAAMKCKQTTDQAHVGTLRGLLAQFRALYFGPEEEAHAAHEHGAK